MSSSSPAWRSACTAPPASMRSPPTPTASTAARTMPGRFVTPDTLARARAAGLDVAGLLAANDCYSLFAAARRPRRHRPDADQRQRFPGDPGDVTPEAARSLRRRGRPDPSHRSRCCGGRCPCRTLGEHLRAALAAAVLVVDQHAALRVVDDVDRPCRPPWSPRWK